eukprot:903296-Pyramimonas_sp.AAC.1
MIPLPTHERVDTAHYACAHVWIIPPHTRGDHTTAHMTYEITFCSVAMRNTLSADDAYIHTSHG